MEADAAALHGRLPRVRPWRQGEQAVYDTAARNVLCLACAVNASQTEIPAVGAVGTEAAVSHLAAYSTGIAAPDAAPPEADPAHDDAATSPINAGTAGASARREFERRAEKREKRIRANHPKLGGLILALTDDPPSITAWRTGAAGSERLGGILDSLADRGVLALHDRRIPRSRANIDHIAIGPAGVFVIDAKRYKGRPSLRVEGGILRPRTETLVVCGRCSNNLIDGMHKLLAFVQGAIGDEVPITGMLVTQQAKVL